MQETTEINLNSLSKEELIAECERRRAVAEQMWTAITVNYGPQGFMTVLQYLESKKVKLP